MPEAFEGPFSREAADALLAPYRRELGVGEPEFSSYAPVFEEQLAVVI